MKHNKQAKNGAVYINFVYINNKLNVNEHKLHLLISSIATSHMYTDEFFERIAMVANVCQGKRILSQEFGIILQTRKMEEARGSCASNLTGIFRAFGMSSARLATSARIYATGSSDAAVICYLHVQRRIIFF